MKRVILSSTQINLNANEYSKLSDIEKKIIAKANNSTDASIYLLGAAEALEIAGVQTTEQFEDVYNYVQENWFNTRGSVSSATFTGEPDPTGQSEGKARFLNQFKSWTDVYRKFTDIIDSYPVEEIDKAVEAVYQFYLRGKGDKNFETAYKKWLDSAE